MITCLIVIALQKLIATQAGTTESAITAMPTSAETYGNVTFTASSFVGIKC